MGSQTCRHPTYVAPLARSGFCIGLDGAGPSLGTLRQNPQAFLSCSPRTSLVQGQAPRRPPRKASPCRVGSRKEPSKAAPPPQPNLPPEHLDPRPRECLHRGGSLARGQGWGTNPMVWPPGPWEAMWLTGVRPTPLVPPEPPGEGPSPPAWHPAGPTLDEWEHHSTACLSLSHPPTWLLDGLRMGHRLVPGALTTGGPSLQQTCFSR